MSRYGPGHWRSSVASVNSSSARERETSSGLPVTPHPHSVSTTSSQKAIGRDSNRGVAADHGAWIWWGGAPYLLMSSHMLTRLTVRSRTTHGAATVTAHEHGDWLHCRRNLGAMPRFGNYRIHGEA